jgi:hypothetical protein
VVTSSVRCLFWNGCESSRPATATTHRWQWSERMTPCSTPVGGVTTPRKARRPHRTRCSRSGHFGGKSFLATGKQCSGRTKSSLPSSGRDPCRWRSRWSPGTRTLVTRSRGSRRRWCTSSAGTRFGATASGLAWSRCGLRESQTVGPRCLRSLTKSSAGRSGTRSVTGRTGARHGPQRVDG